MPKRPPSSVEQAEGFSRKRTADLLRRLRTLQRDLRMLRVRLDGAQNRELRTPHHRKRG